MNQRKPEDLQARRARQAIEGEVAMKEYRANADAMVKRTARLRAERLAREAGQPAPELEPEIKPKAVAKKKKRG